MRGGTPIGSFIDQRHSRVGSLGGANVHGSKLQACIQQAMQKQQQAQETQTPPLEESKHIEQLEARKSQLKALIK